MHHKPRRRDGRGRVPDAVDRPRPDLVGAAASQVESIVRGSPQIGNRSITAEEKSLRSAKGWYLDRKKLLRLRFLRGLCRICCRPRGKERRAKVLCKQCARKDVSRHMRRYYDRKHAGLCPVCESPNVTS